jgi:hypothetical protein
MSEGFVPWVVELRRRYTDDVNAFSWIRDGVLASSASAIRIAKG